MDSFSRVHAQQPGTIENLIRVFVNSEESKHEKVVILPYHWPDLDGIASAMALEAAFATLGFSQAEAAMAERPQIEAEWAIEHFGLELRQLVSHSDERVLLVDTSHPADIPAFVDYSKVIGVLDHRTFGDTASFPYAVCQIDPVAACATLAAEILLRITPKIAADIIATLYMAIMSNSYMLRGSRTTERDRVVVDALVQLYQRPPEDLGTLVEAMYRAKTAATVSDFRHAIESDISSRVHQSGHTTYIIAQLELADGGEIVRESEEKLGAILEAVRATHDVDLVWLQTVDVMKGCTYFLFPTPESASFVMQHFEIESSILGPYLPVPISRKEITEAIESKT